MRYERCDICGTWDDCCSYQNGKWICNECDDAPRKVNWRGQLKAGELLIGHRRHFTNTDGGMVTITDAENHPIWGKRYKILAHEEWFEENCFEYILKG